MVCKCVQNGISELKRGHKCVRLYLPVCLVNCEILPYLQHIGVITFGHVHESYVVSEQMWVGI